MPTDNSQLRKIIIQQADLCVKCGMCSSHCPTYLSSHNENESPRGRIAIAQGLARHSLEADKQLESHIESCLTCLACEKICPSQVVYSELIDNTRQLLQAESPQNNRFVERVSNLSYRQWQKLSTLYRVAGYFGLPKVFTRLFMPRFFHYLRPTRKMPRVNNFQDEVNVFTGCLSNLFDQNTLASVINLLNTCEVKAIIPKEQSCCGALAAHKGFHETANLCQQTNEKCFSENNSPIIFSTSACGAHLKRLVKNGSPAFSRTMEIGEFLLGNEKFQKLKFNSLDKSVLIHSPCSEKNDLRKSTSYQLLEKIPKLTVHKLPEKLTCCGAAGSHMLTNPERAAEIRQWTEDKIIALNPDIIVTTNYTCAMHLGAGLKEKGLDIEVMHPVRLLDQQRTDR